MSSSVLTFTDGGPDGPAWSLARRIGFRFAFAYVLLYVLPFPAGFLPWTDSISEAWMDAAQGVAVWVGEALFGFEDIKTAQTGSGDRLVDYLLLLCTTAAAAVAAVVWSIADRRRASYPRLAAGLRVVIRYVLAFTLIHYGAVKVLPSQFSFPDPSRLPIPLGEMSPMSLLWQFMGYSTPYTVFTGAAEVLGGALLLSRRTTTLGALISIGVLANVVALNFCYDVPVKLYSSHLLLAAIALAAPDARRMIDLLVRNRAVPAADLGAPPADRRWRRARLAAKLALIVLVVGSTVHTAWDSYTTWGAGAPRPSVHGVWTVEAFERDGEAVPPLATDPARWRVVTIGRAVAVLAMDGTRRWGKLERDDATGATTLKLRGDDDGAGLAVRDAGEGELEISGRLDGADVTIRLRRKDDYLLVTRGFRWVNEVPFNR